MKESRQSKKNEYLKRKQQIKKAKGKTEKGDLIKRKSEAMLENKIVLERQEHPF